MQLKGAVGNLLMPSLTPIRVVYQIVASVTRGCLEDLVCHPVCILKK